MTNMEICQRANQKLFCGFTNSLARWWKEGSLTTSHAEKLPNTQKTHLRNVQAKCRSVTPQKCCVIKKRLATLARPTARINTWVTTVTRSSSLYFRAETHPKINYTPLLLLNSPTVCPEVSLSDVLFRLLRSNSCVVQLKISSRPSAVDTSDPLFNTWKPQMQLESYTPVWTYRCPAGKTGRLDLPVVPKRPKRNHKGSKNLPNAFCAFWMNLRGTTAAFNYDVGCLNTYRIKSGSIGLVLLLRAHLVWREQTIRRRMKPPNEEPWEQLLQ